MRRLARTTSCEARARHKKDLVAVATNNVRTLTVKGKHGYHMDMPSACWRMLGNLAGASSAWRKRGGRGRHIFPCRVPGFLLSARENGNPARIVGCWAGSQGIDMSKVCIHPSVD